VNGLVIDYARASADVLDRLPGLKVVSCTATGVEYWADVPHATRLGIAVCNVPDWSTDAVAEFTFGLIVAVARRLGAADRLARRPGWHDEGLEGAHAALRGMTLRGRTLGLVGFGHIGQRVAEIASGFGLRVLVHTRRPDAPRRTEARVELVPLEELLRRSDILSLHCPLTDETRGLIGARELALLPPRAILINTARGAVVDEAALVEALKSGARWGAGLDVFEREPLPEGHPLAELDNVVLAPHLAAITDAALRNLYATSLRNLDAFASGHPTNVVNPEVLAR
jgi:phosphoglycerate dehydrogenase-like enzyme